MKCVTLERLSFICIFLFYPFLQFYNMQTLAGFLAGFTDKWVALGMVSEVN